MKLSDLFESSRVKIPSILYKATTDAAWKMMQKRKAIFPRGWKHYIESVDKMVAGNSFTDKKHLKKWTLPDSDVILSLDVSKLTNDIYPINGNRTYLQTKGRTSSVFDPTAYQDESEEIDEFFVAGKIPLSAITKVEKI